MSSPASDPSLGASQGSSQTLRRGRAGRVLPTDGTAKAPRHDHDQGWWASARRHLAHTYSGVHERAVDTRHLDDIERLLAFSRCALGLAVVAALGWGHSQMHPPVAHALGAAFAVYAAVVAVLSWRGTSPLRARALHLADLGWAAILSLVSGGTSSSAFPLFVFVIVAGGYRWGLARSLLDGALTVVLACMLSVPALAGLTPWSFELDLFVLRVSYTIIVAVLFGVLAERQLVLSGQAAALAGVVGQIGRSRRLGPAVRDSLDCTLRLLDARQAFLVVEEFDTRQTFVWHAERDAGRTETSYVELSPSDRALWLPPLPEGVAAGYARRRARSDGPVPVSLALDVEGRARPADFEVAHPLADAWTWRSLMFVPFGERDEGMGRLYVLDLDRRPFMDSWLRFLQTLARQLSPLLMTRYLLRRVRTRIGSRERQRVSLELHDSLVQSLVALEMRLDVLARPAPDEDPETVARGHAGHAGHLDYRTAEIHAIRVLLHKEILGVRDLMERLQPIAVDAERLPLELQAILDRFTRTTGIAAALDWAVATLELSPQACREVVRIVQEALVNVRRHSGASRVVVRVESDASGWALIVEDNGHGLSEVGRLTHDDPVAARIGPRVIRERVTALGGTLTLFSSLRGLRLEMAFASTQE